MAGEDPAAGGARGSGLLGSVKGLLRTLLDIAQTRLQLLANEIQAEALRLGTLAFYGAAAAFFLSLAVFFGTLFVIMAFWEAYGIAVIGIFAVVYAIVGGMLLRWVLRMSSEHSRLFQASIDELERDREHLKT